MYHGPGNYTCSLDSSIHVVLSVESTQFPAIFPLLYSLKQHHTKPLIIHIVANKKDSQELQIQLECRGLMTSMKVYYYTVEYYYIVIHMHTSID